MYRLLSQRSDEHGKALHVLIGLEHLAEDLRRQTVPVEVRIRDDNDEAFVDGIVRLGLQRVDRRLQGGERVVARAAEHRVRVHEFDQFQPFLVVLRRLILSYELNGVLVAGMADDVIDEFLLESRQRLEKHQHAFALTFETIVDAVEAIHRCRKIDDETKPFGFRLRTARFGRNVSAGLVDGLVADDAFD